MIPALSSGRSHAKQHMNDSRNPALRLPGQGQRLQSSRPSPLPVKVAPAQALNLQPVSPVDDLPPSMVDSR